MYFENSISVKENNKVRNLTGMAMIFVSLAYLLFTLFNSGPSVGALLFIIPIFIVGIGLLFIKGEYQNSNGE